MGDFGYLFISESDNHVFRFEIGVDNAAHPMHVVKANQTLASQLADEGDGYALVVITFDELEEVDTEDLENHDEMLAIGAVVDERVEELDAVRGFTAVA